MNGHYSSVCPSTPPSPPLPHPIHAQTFLAFFSISSLSVDLPFHLKEKKENTRPPTPR